MEKCNTCKDWKEHKEYGHVCASKRTDDEIKGWCYILEGGEGYLDYEKIVFIPGSEYGCVHHRT